MKHDGYISSITLPNGKTYKLRCEAAEAYSTDYPKCGGEVEFKYKSGSEEVNVNDKINI